MNDIICAKCGEPWDYSGLFGEDVEYGEGKRILNGEGCLCCDFGKDKDKCKGRHQGEYMLSLLNNSEGDELASL